MATVLFALLFQSLHSYEHFLDDRIAVHEKNDVQKDVHQNGHDHEHCFVCEFTFNQFVSTSVFTFHESTVFEVNTYHFFYTEAPSFFAGNQSLLRGPPCFFG